MGRRSVKAAVSSLKGAGAVTAVDLIIAAAWSFLAAIAFLPALGLILLLESAALMLIGGAMSFSGQPGMRRLTALLTRTRIQVSKTETEDLDAKAAVFALVGVLLFLESLALSAAML